LTFADGTAMNLGAIPSGPYTNVQLVNNPGGGGGQIDLQVTSYPITWSGGSNGNAWDTTTFNWAFAPPSGVSSVNYVEGAYVTFADNSLFGAPVANTNGIATVNVQPTGVNPGPIAFTNVGAAHSGVDYVVNGGSIGGAATVLTKTDTGIVTINTTNTYGGGTVINGGTIVAGQPTSLGTGPVTLAGGTLRLGTNLSGFGGTSASTAGTAIWTVNSSGITGNPINSDVLTLTDNGGNEARSAFYNVQAPVVGSSSGFSAQFTYTPSGNKAADGIAFILQNSPSGTSAIGQTNAGSALGYGGTNPITPSVAFEMNLFTTNTVGVAWRSNGATGSPYTAVSGVNLASGDPIRVQLNYNQANTTLTAILTDTTTKAVATFSSNSLNVADILGQGTAYVGFSGADGGSTST
jgi:autotransporter-associated beta strand protein